MTVTSYAGKRFIFDTYTTLLIIEFRQPHPCIQNSDLKTTTVGNNVRQQINSERSTQTWRQKNGG